MASTSGPRRIANRLGGETSPYLAQHAGNPVDWFPWGEEALEKARREDKPIFLSIGYSACHWCHVMERESFENEEIAALLNQHFVSIKVDREERPDLDEIYMAAVQIISGRGGWPLSVWLTPELKPFYGGTYFPPSDHHGHPGFGRLLQRLAEIYRMRRDEVEEGAGHVAERLASFSQLPPGHGLISAGLAGAAVNALLASFDPEHGGFGGPPKFPHSMGVQLLWRSHRRSGDLRALEAAVTTLDRMAAGGIYDHLGGGFHRYAVDDRWLVPHFEKMLYDQALLVPAYLEGFQITASRRYRQVITETLEFVLREMTSPDGGFHSTLDADSEGEEGRFYTWTREEVLALLGPDEGQLFCRAYDVDEVGNFERRSILHPIVSAESLAASQKRPVHEVESSLEASRARLLEARASRVRPGRDDKILAGWNGLMISALARAGSALDEPRFVIAASRAGDFVLQRMQDDGRLLHVSMDGVAKIDGFLEDYGALIAAFTDLYEASFEDRWLCEALRLAEVMRAEFADPSGGFFNTSHRHRDLIVRVKNAQDGSTPSGNSLAATALLRLGRLTGRSDLERDGEQTLRAYQRLLEHAPGAFHQMLLAADLYLGPRVELVIAGSPDDPCTRALLRSARGRFLPRVVIAAAYPDGGRTRDHSSPVEELTRGKALVNGLPAAYLCRNSTCESPVTACEDLEKALDLAASAGA